ncbi:hypothetical protein [Goodfellowiella coeruleoviolacea]|uniref:Uncharacterized protein n=1 Tax=Goodfellowiella coeruleoviolacea TaxID=334858 RepID=A0AAE3GB69_9PSEU|nr:hypothetical protein [Goodfellowiella coeruleoviolacea]MCP2164920.1 hypothetical protein [Goodfellowiella coeruleoviolacea]
MARLGEPRIVTRPRSHGRARYRVDGTGNRVLVLPMRCPSGRHVLPTTGYRTTSRDGVLHVECTACATASSPDHAWRLDLAGELPPTAEFDAEPYASPHP